MKEGLDSYEMSLLDLFKRLSFREYIRKISDGLKQPYDTGDNKWARLQITRLWSPVSAVVVPLLVVMFLCLITFARPISNPITITIKEPDTIEELDKREEQEVDPMEISEIEPDLLEVDLNATGNSEFQEDFDSDYVPTRFSPLPASLDTVAMVNSPVILNGILQGRTPSQRGKARAKFGAPAGSEGAVMRALRWLKKNQNSDGSWNNVKPAMTSLALLAFLAHGETPASREFGYTVESAIRWLLDNQEGNGHFLGRDKHDYSQPIAAYGLCEAFALIKTPKVGVGAKKAIRVLLHGQHSNGGWDYNCRDGDRDDTSYMGWCAQALKAAKLAELYVDDHDLDAAMRRAVGGFRKNYSRDNYRGTFGYTKPGDTGLTGVGVLCLQLLGASNSVEVKGGLTALEKATFNWDGGGVYNKNYYWYYITQAKFHAGGDIWKSWNRKFAPILIKRQTIIEDAIKDSNGRLVDIGFWDMNEKITGHTDGVVMNTCLCVLQLEVYYRYLPTYQPPKDIKAEIEDKDEIEVRVQ